MSRESLLKETTESRRLLSETRLDRSKIAKDLPEPWNKMYLRLMSQFERDVMDMSEYSLSFKALLQELVYSFVLHRKDMIETGHNGKWRDSDKWKDILFRLISLQDRAREKKLERNIFAAMASVLEEKVEDEVIRKDLLGCIVKKLSEIKEE